MSKFKVGDTVIGNELASKNYGITKQGWMGVVTNVAINTFSAANIYDKYCKFNGLRYDYFDLLQSTNHIANKMRKL